MAVNWTQAFFSPKISRSRVWFAFAVAAVTDAIQLALGPVGWFIIDEILDVIAMGLISWAIGFHPLLLPTFVLELMPIADMLPTWTGCTAAVVFMRRKSNPTTMPTVSAEAPPSIDVPSEVTRVPPVIRK